MGRLIIFKLLLLLRGRFCKREATLEEAVDTRCDLSSFINATCSEVPRLYRRSTGGLVEDFWERAQQSRSSLPCYQDLREHSKTLVNTPFRDDANLSGQCQLCRNFVSFSFSAHGHHRRYSAAQQPLLL
ncbi:hypothetical protein MTO96_006180 [Rhipicephalus appendiculatus]